MGRLTSASSVALAFALLSPAPATAGEKTIAYYDPNAAMRTEKIEQTGVLINDYLRKEKSDLRFRYFARSKDFEAAVKERETKLVIVSSEAVERDGGSRFQPLLVPTSRGNPYFENVLVVSDKPRDRTTLVVATVAPPGTRSTPGVSRATSAAVRKKSTVLSVPNVKSALIAVSDIRNADAALVPSYALTGQRPGLKIVYRSPKTLRSPLCAVVENTSAKERAALTTLIERMAKDETGRQALLHMGFDSWTPYERRKQR